jgi:hypothetical protein
VVGSKATPKGHPGVVQEKGVGFEGMVKAGVDKVTCISWGVVSVEFEKIDEEIDAEETVRNKMQDVEAGSAQSMAGWSG